MIRFGEQESHIRTVVVKKDKEYQIDMHLKHNRSKGIAINKVPIKKASELFGILNMVFFSPEDLNIIKRYGLQTGFKGYTSGMGYAAGRNWQENHSAKKTVC